MNGPAEIKPLPDAPQTTGRRAALARWLTQPDHPLTSRVIVNRIWQYHFGRGLAANASDFGKLGGPPTHPELLDWLASQFVADGWSVKQLHRRIVCSATYRQSAEHPNLAAGRLKDPENRLHWRGSVRRLDAEQIRDSLYAATGELQLIPGGPGAAKEEPRRSIFLRVMRNTARAIFRCVRRAVLDLQRGLARRDDHADPGAAADQQPVHAATFGGLCRAALRFGRQAISNG